MICGAYSLMHCLVDLVCAWAMFSRFRYAPDAYGQLLIYNFCAFALQMPAGTLLDLVMSRCPGRKAGWCPQLVAGAGMLLTLAGAFTVSWVLGLGNALFHVGGGVDVIREDKSSNSRGGQLGIFVAPGAVGLYLGTILAERDSAGMVCFFSGFVMLFLFAGLVVGRRKKSFCEEAQAGPVEACSIAAVAFCCFAVVLLRSVTGFYAVFSWKESGVLSALWVAAVALGKMAGGIGAAKFGMRPAAAVSLTLAAGCFLLVDIPVFGFAAVFLFNMTMPITLYRLVRRLPRLPGFSFGLLTFGLFLGFLPYYAGLSIPLSAGMTGFAGSVLSLVLLCGRIGKT